MYVCPPVTSINWVILQTQPTAHAFILTRPTIASTHLSAALGGLEMATMGMSGDVDMSKFSAMPVAMLTDAPKTLWNAE
jgi:hypothetical protein